MLKRLRWQLTLLYLLAALGLTALLGAGSYSLLRKTFDRTTDLAIQYKMAATFEAYGLPLPDPLREARSTWLQTYAVEISDSPARASQDDGHSDEKDDEGDVDGEDHKDEDHSDDDQSDEAGEPHEEDLYDARLAALFVFPLGPNGELLGNPNANQPPISPNRAAAAEALSKVSDWRTVSLQNGARVRMYTYRNDGPGGPALFQVGRLLNDQDRAMSQFLVSLVFLGSASILVLGGLSWRLSGRSLGPAQKAWDQQRVFVANASHELRTPLTLIRASAEYGLMSDAGPEIRPLLEDIRRECDYMNRQVEDLLLLSRLDAGRLKLDQERIILAQLMQDTCAQMDKLAAERQIHLTLGKVEGIIRGDPLRIRQVLLILLDNAFRFTPPGGVVKLEARLQKKRVLILVADNGRGIEPDHIPHVFERFYQAGSPAQDGAHSNGLGLSIARALVEAQGGSIHLESQVGQGTQVRLDFPAAE